MAVAAGRTDTWLRHAHRLKGALEPMMLSTEDEARVRAAIATPGQAADLYANLLRRADRWSAAPGVATPADDGGAMDWRHVVWERLTDVAFIQRMDPAAERGEWLRNEVLAICDRPADDWIGPFFRPRENPPQGMLETAHIGIALATALWLCPDLFDQAEQERIRVALRSNCHEPCRTALPHRSGNNWFMVLLAGFATTAVLLDDAEAIKASVEHYQHAHSLYQPDSYDESLQYWNYASVHLAHTRDVLLAHDPRLADRLDVAAYTQVVPWAVYSHLAMKPTPGWGPGAYPRALNFGDSAAMFRPSGDLLLHIASRSRASHPTEAGLARWLFDTTYADPALPSAGGDTFGFFNNYRWRSLALLSEAAEAIGPEDAGLPRTRGFAAGPVITRDDWRDDGTVLGMQAGHEQLRTASHRHCDENSFMVIYRGERILADPGHCTYRLPANRASAATDSHSTWTFATADGHPLEQAKPTTAHSPSNRRTLLTDDGQVTAVRADAASAYGEPITRAERTWLAILPNIVLIIDRIEASEPVHVRSHFIANNRDNALQTNIASHTRLVFRRGDVALKLLQVASQSPEGPNVGDLQRGWTSMHDVYHPEPNQRGQSREGAGARYTLTTARPATSHLAVYAVLMDEESSIRAWHATGSFGDGIEMSNAGSSLWRLQLTDDGAPTLTDVSSGRVRSY